MDPTTDSGKIESKRNVFLTSRQIHISIPVRLGYLAIGVAVFVASYYVGAVWTLPSEDADAIRQDMTSKVENIDDSGIFANNIVVALGMFIPALGVALGVYSGFSTGLVVSAFAAVTPALAETSPLLLLGTPFAILEVLAYGLAISRSGLLVAQLLKARKEWKRFAAFTLIEIAIVIAVLFAGSMIEGQALQNGNG
jgi:uncharacterized membrane protein SpoIIM required for sporulation